jgi:hypothetical protein
MVTELELVSLAQTTYCRISEQEALPVSQEKKKRCVFTQLIIAPIVS